MSNLTHAWSMPGSRLVMALAISTTLVVCACAGSASPSASVSATASQGATSPASVFDQCLVGTWTVVAQNQNSPANDESISYTGGTGEVYTIDAQGGVTIDTGAAQTISFTSAGQTFTAVVAGTGHGKLSTVTNGDSKTLFFTPSSDDTRTTHSFGPSGVELGPARPDTAFSAAYTCAPGRFTFYKVAVNYMVDGPIETLTSSPS